MLQNANKNQKLTVTIYRAIKMKRPSFHHHGIPPEMIEFDGKSKGNL